MRRQAAEASPKAGLCPSLQPPSSPFASFPGSFLPQKAGTPCGKGTSGPGGFSEVGGLYHSRRDLLECQLFHH